jgi:predicted HNH restriction endonuclease
MGKRLPTTPRSKVRAAIRQLWLRSRERAAALKRDGYTCQRCGKKQSTAKGKEQKVEVHHKEGIGNWEKVIDLIFAEILCDPIHLKTVCPDCHDTEEACKIAEGIGL